MRYAYSNELWHHGVQGQKWGVKHGPPYPLYEGHGKSKAVLESKAKYGPNNTFGSIASNKKLFKRTALEIEMAKRTRNQNWRNERLTKKAEKKKEGKKKDRILERAANAKATVDRYNEIGIKYSKLSVDKQKEINRGYTRAMVILETQYYKTPVQERTILDRYSHVENKNRALNDTLFKIESEYEKSKKK